MAILKDFSIQLYSVRDEAQKDFAATLEKVAKMGYTGVEFAGYGGFSPGEMCELLAKTGLKAVSSHVSIENMSDNFDAETEMNKAVGNDWLVIPWYDFSGGTDAVDEFCEKLSLVMPKLKAAGFKVGYHNHDGEFAKIGDRYIMDILLERNPDLFLEFDIYWAAYADVDYMKYIENHRDQLKLLHVKQIAADGSKKCVDLDEGAIDFADVVAKCSSVEHFIFEQEEYDVSSLHSAELGARYILG